MMLGKVFRIATIAFVSTACLLSRQATTNSKQIWKGVIWDSTCTEVGDKKPDSEEAAQVIRHCVDELHHRPVLIVSGKGMPIGNVEAVSAFLGRSVIVEGTFKDNMLVVVRAALEAGGPAHERSGGEGGIISQLGGGGSAPPDRFGGRKPSVAILDFGYDSVRSSVNTIFGSNQDVGKAIGNVVRDHLVRDGSYRVVEGRELASLMREQGLSSSNRGDAATAAKIGAKLGVDFVLIGDVTQFGHGAKSDGDLGAGSCCAFGLGKFGPHKTKAVVEITARLVDVRTGEIVSSAGGHGESSRSSTDLLGAGKAGKSDDRSDMSSSGFNQSLLGEAVTQSANQLAVNLDKAASSLPQPVKVDGLVADASSGEVIINVGGAAGIHVGDKLTITRVSRTIKDPDTGATLANVEAPVGTMTVTSVDARSAAGVFTGSGSPQVGDKVQRR